MGQLAFNHEVPGATVVAIPLYEDIPEEYGNRELYLFAFIAHEAFHQYQRHEFTDVETSSEELYPMLDSINNALAGVELRALLDAAELLSQSDSAQLRDPTRLAVAVHNYRWERLNPIASTIERGKEVVEGTAQYIEAGMVAGLAASCRSGTRAYGGLCNQAVDAPRWLAADLQRRVSKGALEPTDMARNRIYSMAATVGLLLDVYDPDWKLAVTRDGTSQGLFERLNKFVPDTQDARFALLERARERYGWELLLSASGSLVREYTLTFDEKLRAFNASAGVRVVLLVPAANTTRSRASREMRWVVDSGNRVLGRYVEYALRNREGPQLVIRIRNAEVLDESDTEGYRTITFFSTDSIALTTNDQRLPTDVAADFQVEAISFETSSASLRASLPGMASIRPGEVRITLWYR